MLEERVLPDDKTTIKVRVKVLFENEKDEAECEIFEDGKWEKIGTPHKLRFRLDHFTGARFGLFAYSQKEPGGQAGFSEFMLEEA